MASDKTRLDVMAEASMLKHNPPGDWDGSAVEAACSNCALAFAEEFKKWARGKSGSAGQWMQEFMNHMSQPEEVRDGEK